MIEWVFGVFEIPNITTKQLLHVFRSHMQHLMVFFDKNLVFRCSDMPLHGIKILLIVNVLVCMQGAMEFGELQLLQVLVLFLCAVINLHWLLEVVYNKVHCPLLPHNGLVP